MQFVVTHLVDVLVVSIGLVTDETLDVTICGSDVVGALPHVDRHSER